MQNVFSLESRRRTRRNEEYQSSPLNPNTPKLNQSINPRFSYNDLSTRNVIVQERNYNNGRPIPYASISTYDARLKLGDASLLLPLSSTLNRLIEEGAFSSGNIKCNLEKRMVKKTKHVYNFVKVKDTPSVTEPVELVPIRLELDLGDYYLKDVFMWNLKESLLSVQNFSEILCMDLNMYTSNNVNIIEESINSQIQSYKSMMETLNENEDLFMDYEQGMELSIKIKLNLLIGTFQYQDQFEWSIESTITPEEFAIILCSELGIGGEFKNIIAHTIHEKKLNFLQQKVEAIPLLKRKTQNLGRNETDELLKSTLKENLYLQTVENNQLKMEPPSTLRNINVENHPLYNVTQFTPTLIHLDSNLLEKSISIEESKSRNQRRRRDGTSRRAPLPKRMHTNNNHSPSNGSPYVFD